MEPRNAQPKPCNPSLLSLGNVPLLDASLLKSRGILHHRFEN